MNVRVPGPGPASAVMARGVEKAWASPWPRRSRPARALLGEGSPTWRVRPASGMGPAAPPRDAVRESGPQPGRACNSPVHCPPPSLARLPRCRAWARPWVQRALRQSDPSWPDRRQPSLASWKQLGPCRARPSKRSQPQHMASATGCHPHPFPPEQGEKLPPRKLRLITCFPIRPAGSAPRPAPAGRTARPALPRVVLGSRRQG